METPLEIVRFILCVIGAITVVVGILYFVTWPFRTLSEMNQAQDRLIEKIDDLDIGQDDLIEDVKVICKKLNIKD